MFVNTPEGRVAQTSPLRQGVCPGYLPNSSSVRPAGLTPLFHIAPRGLSGLPSELLLRPASRTDPAPPEPGGNYSKGWNSVLVHQRTLGEIGARPNHQTGQAPSPPPSPNAGKRACSLRPLRDPHRLLDRTCRPSHSTQPPPSPTLLRAESLKPLHCAKGSVRATLHTPPPSGQQD